MTSQDVAANSDKNKMGTDNVALVFAPNILRPQAQQEQSSLLNDATAVKDILRLLIEELPFMREGVMRSKKPLILPAGSSTDGVCFFFFFFCLAVCMCWPPLTIATVWTGVAAWGGGRSLTSRGGAPAIGGALCVCSFTCHFHAEHRD